MDAPPRTTALLEHHRAAGAQLTQFAGWLLPVRFAGTLAEHAAVRSAVGVFDVSHLGTVGVSGPGALATIAATFTNDPRQLEDGRAQYTLCCDATGGVVDDLIVSRLDPDRWLVIPNAANTAAVVAALTAHADGEVEIVDSTAAHAVLAVQGPRAWPTLATALAAAGIDGLPGGALAPFEVTEVGPVDRSGRVEQAHGYDEPKWGIIAGTGYTGERGAEVIVPASWAPRLWEALVAAGAVPCGLGARDTLRLEMGFPLYGNELSRAHTPYEAGLGWTVKLDRGPFCGSEALGRAHAQTPTRRLWGLVAEGRRPLRAGMRVLADDGSTSVGALTSGTLAPTLQQPIGLAYLDVPVAPGDMVGIDLRGTLIRAQVVRPPLLTASDRARR